MLQKWGLSYYSGMSKGKMDNHIHIHDSSYVKDDFSISDEHSLKPAHKRIKLDETKLTAIPSTGCLPVNGSSSEASDVIASTPGLRH